ncbi:hypothetical protein CsSME_00028237 [Camellia sinensis var. sinensis]
MNQFTIAIQLIGEKSYCQLDIVAPPKPSFISVEVLTDTVEAARKPSVAAIDGLALGGGLEVAMACHAQIPTLSAQLGLPELRLGVIPGFEGIALCLNLQ